MPLVTDKGLNRLVLRCVNYHGDLDCTGPVYPLPSDPRFPRTTMEKTEPLPLYGTTTMVQYYVCTVCGYVEMYTATTKEVVTPAPTVR